MNKQKSTIELESVKCILCENDDTRVMYKNFDRIHNICGIFNIVQCNHCGLFYVNPRPTLEFITRYYPRNYGSYQQSSTQEQCIIADNPIRKGLKALYHLVSLQPLLRLLENRTRNLSLYCRINEETLILDIGCATGEFLKKCKDEFGCKVYGVEMDEVAADYARYHNAINVHTGRFLTSNFPSSFFDCITMWSVLEHTHNPASVLKEARRILKNSGIVVIFVPNAKSIGRYLFRDKWYGWDTPRHLYGFSPRTITQILNKEGFKVIGIEHDYSTWSLMGSLQYLLAGEKKKGAKYAILQASKAIDDAVRITWRCHEDVRENSCLCDKPLRQCEDDTSIQTEIEQKRNPNRIGKDI